MTEGLERKMEKNHKMLVYLGAGTGFFKRSLCSRHKVSLNLHFFFKIKKFSMELPSHPLLSSKPPGKPLTETRKIHLPWLLVSSFRTCFWSFSTQYVLAKTQLIDYINGVYSKGRTTLFMLSEDIHRNLFTHKSIKQDKNPRKMGSLYQHFWHVRASAS